MRDLASCLGPRGPAEAECLNAVCPCSVEQCRQPHTRALKFGVRHLAGEIWLL